MQSSPVTTGLVIGGLIALAIALTEIIKALIAKKRNGNGAGSNGKLSATVAKDIEEMAKGQSDCQSHLMGIRAQVGDRDGVPLAHHMREQMKVSRAMLGNLEVLTRTQGRTCEILDRLEKRTHHD